VSGDTLEQVSAKFDEKTSTIQATIDRIRPFVTSVLKKRWVDKPRPGRIHGVDNSVMSRIGLIVDCTTFPVNRPVGRFEESKIYWDDKNSMYGLKKVKMNQSKFIIISY
jgi:hypothetical protein